MQSLNCPQFQHLPQIKDCDRSENGRVSFERSRIWQLHLPVLDPILPETPQAT
jgi:hypothetical protein